MSNIPAAFPWRSEQPLGSHNFVVPLVLEWLREIGARRVLDLGSGNGYLCGELARAGFDVVGVEYDVKGISISKQAHPSIAFYRMGVEDDPADLAGRERLFDAVVSTEVVEHLYSPHLLPRFAASVLKPGGRLLVTTPYHGYVKNLALAVTGKLDAHFCALWHGGHIKFWSRSTLEQLLAAEGFRVTSFHGLGRLPFLWKSMALGAVKT